MGLKIGLDFGSTTSIVSIYDTDRKALEAVTYENDLPYIPSKISYGANDEGTVKIGNQALNDIINNKKRRFFQAFKTLLNNDASDAIVRSRGYDDNITPEKAAYDFIDTVLRTILRYRSETVIDKLVIGVPEKWGKSVRNMHDGSDTDISRSFGTQRICNILKKMDCIKDFEIVFEPEAASAFFAYNYNNNPNIEGTLNDNILIIDYGGGSLDITLSKVNTFADGKMEIRLLDSDGLGENTDGKLGKAGILYIEALIEKAIKEAGFTDVDINDIALKASFDKIKQTVETNLKNAQDDIEDAFNIDDIEGASEELKEILLTQDCIITMPDGEKRFFNINYYQLYCTYEEFIKPSFDMLLQRFVKNGHIDIENKNFKIGLVGGFSNFYLVRRQIWKTFRISSASDRCLTGLLTDPTKQGQAISLGAALLANDMIHLCKTSEFAIGVYTIENINGRNIPVPHFAIKFRQEYEFYKKYYSKNLDGKTNQIIDSHSGNIDRLIIMRDNDPRHIHVIRPDEKYAEKLRNVINYQAQIAFSITPDGQLKVHVESGEAGKNGMFTPSGSEKEITLTDFDHLTSNVTRNPGQQYEFAEWLALLQSGKLPNALGGGIK
ncbi:hypothetical protein [uncultured Ruminococcus sp.]|uniref:hypothetical protein n=1 Tax=uncultured Ruminococcus sp. TaxID=165186 RepID=UPI0025F166D0|nr:hypothetical protein [uncultured Ruminococcus sp.]